MMRSSLLQIRHCTVIWQRTFVWRWLPRARDHLPFLAMASLPVVAVAAIIYFSWLQDTRIEPARIEVLQREARRAARRASDLHCLAENIYFEARGEPLKGQYAVAEVTLNRTRAPNFPHTICGVVHEMRWDPSRRRYTADFSWTQLGALSPDDGPAWKQAMAIATAEYDDMGDPVVPGALFYHAKNVRPGWAKARRAITTIGHHVFYR